MPLPPSLPLHTHTPTHLPLHCQHSSKHALSESEWAVNGEREGWARAKQARSVCVHLKLNDQTLLPYTMVSTETSSKFILHSNWALLRKLAVAQRGNISMHNMASTLHPVCWSVFKKALKFLSGLGLFTTVCHLYEEGVQWENYWFNIILPDYQFLSIYVSDMAQWNWPHLSVIVFK